MLVLLHLFDILCWTIFLVWNTLESNLVYVVFTTVTLFGFLMLYELLSFIAWNHKQDKALVKRSAK
jgi:hypothetical protein